MKLFQAILLPLLLLATLSSCAQRNGEQKSKNAKPTKRQLRQYTKATFAGGCFWSAEAIFESISGVQEVICGYCGGSESHPTFEQVQDGLSSHAQSIEVYYDPKEINYEQLLRVYLNSMNRTKGEGQEPEHGKQYRCVIFYRSNSEQAAARNALRRLDARHTYQKAVSIAVLPFDKFWEAEELHQDYIRLHPTDTYVLHTAIPRIRSFQSKFPELIKNGYNY